MPVQWQNMDFPFQGGVNEKIADEILPPGLLTIAKNIRQRKSGEIVPRYGYTTLGNTVAGPSGNDYTLNDVNSIHARDGDDLLVFGDADDGGTVEPSAGTGFYRYSDTSTEFHKAGNGVPAEIDVKIRSAVSLENTQLTTAIGYAHYSGTTWADKVVTHYVYVVGYAGAASKEVRIYDAAGNYIPCQAGTAANFITLTASNLTGVSVFTGSQNEFLIWHTNSTPSVSYYRIDMSQPQLYGSTTAYATGSTYAQIKVAHDEDDPDEHFMCYRDAGTSDLVVSRINNGQTADWTQTVMDTAALTTNSQFDILYDSTNAYLHIFAKDATSGTIFHGALNASTGAIINLGDSTTDLSDTTITAAGGGGLSVAWDTQYGAGQARIFMHSNTSAADSGGGKIETYLVDTSDHSTDSNKDRDFFGVQPRSRAFTYNNRAYVWTMFGDSDLPQNGLYLLTTAEDNAGGMLAVLAARALDGLIETTSVQAPVYEMAPGKFGTTVGKASNVTGANTESSLAEVAVDLAPMPAPGGGVGNSLLVGSGVLHSVSAEASELGWCVAPVIDTLTPVGSGGNMTGGTYSFKVVAVYVDSSGETHRSTPSGASTDTFAASGRYTMIVNMPSVTNRDYSDCFLEIYISTASGTTHYYTETLQLADAQSVTISNEDPGTDTTIQTGAILYTDQGELSADSAPPVAAMAFSATRGICIPADNRRAFRATKPKAVGFAMEWPLALEYAVDTREELTAVAHMDGRWIMFSPSEIFWFAGEGPNASGQGIFSTIQKLPTSVGSLNANVLVGDAGIIFQSRKGLYLLDRSLQLSYIGAPIEDTNTDTVYAGTLVGDENEYRFLHGTDSTHANALVSMPAATELAVYDSHHQQWYRDDLSDALGAAGTILDSVVWNGVYVLATRTGASSDTVRIVKEDSTVYQDWGTNFDRQITTGWVRPVGLNGYMRTRRVGFFGDWVSTHSAVLTVYARENGSTADVAKTFAATSDPTEYAYETRLKNQKTTAFQIDLAVTGVSGQGFKWYGLSMEIGVKKGMRKIPPARSV